VTTSKMKTMLRNKYTVLLLSFICAAVSLLFGCGANQGVLRSGREDNTQYNAPANTKSEFESDMESMRTAGFAFVYVLRRSDGGKMDASDRALIKAQTADTNRRVATDEDRAIIIGSNFQVPDANLKALRARFSLETYAEPAAENSNVNANATK
jgi:hypothetical protein